MTLIAAHRMHVQQTLKALNTELDAQREIASTHAAASPDRGVLHEIYGAEHNLMYARSEIMGRKPEAARVYLAAALALVEVAIAGVEKRMKEMGA